MIDTHCHFDIMDNPLEYINRCERNKLITIGMTNLPSHFQQGLPHVSNYRYIRLALGLHPLLANEHPLEYDLFKSNISKTSYIGEVGLDFSREGISTKDLQIRSFEFVLNAIKAHKKIINLHSRKAEAKVLDMLTVADVHNAIFHWYTGSLKTLDKIIDQGHYISVNSAMVKNANGRSIINRIPLTNILTETDSPYINDSNISKVVDLIADQRGVDRNSISSQISKNFRNLLTTIR